VAWWRKDLRLWQPDVLEVTERLEEQIRGRELRGEVWSLSRQGDGSKNDAVVGEFCQRFPAEKVAPCFEILSVVQRCYHCPDLRFGATNPLPAPVVLPMVEGEAPALPLDRPPPASVPASQEEIDALRAKMRRTFGLNRNRDQGDSPTHGKNGQAKPLPSE
jgi:hypothetical protein